MDQLQKEKKTFFAAVRKVKGVDERRQRGCLRHHGVQLPDFFISGPRLYLF